MKLVGDPKCRRCEDVYNKPHCLTIIQRGGRHLGAVHKLHHAIFGTFDTFLSGPMFVWPVKFCLDRLLFPGA